MGHILPECPVRDAEIEGAFGKGCGRKGAWTQKGQGAYGDGQEGTSPKGSGKKGATWGKGKGAKGGRWRGHGRGWGARRIWEDEDWEGAPSMFLCGLWEGGRRPTSQAPSPCVTSTGKNGAPSQQGGGGNGVWAKVPPRPSPRQTPLSPQAPHLIKRYDILRDLSDDPGIAMPRAGRVGVLERRTRKGERKSGNQLDLSSAGKTAAPTVMEGEWRSEHPSGKSSGGGLQGRWPMHPQGWKVEGGQGIWSDAERRNDVPETDQICRTPARAMRPQGWQVGGGSGILRERVRGVTIAGAC